MTLRKIPLDPMTKAAGEIEEVIGFVRRAVPMFKRAVGVLQDLSGLLQEQGAPAPMVPTAVPAKLTEPCYTCGATGVLGNPGYQIACPKCEGRGVL